MEDGRRFARCVRCDAWVQTTPPPHPTAETLPPISELKLPKRGRALRERFVLRLIAVDRGVHSVIFGLLAIGLIIVDLRFASLQAGARDLVEKLTGAATTTGPAASRGFIVRELIRFLNLKSHTLFILAGTAVAYCVVEGVEAVGLWMERRWAEYLTAVATAGFLPFEIHELIDRVTPLRVVALVVNLAILAYLVSKKRLFGVRGGAAAMEQEEEFDREELFGPPRSLRRDRREAVALERGDGA